MFHLLAWLVFGWIVGVAVQWFHNSLNKKTQTMLPFFPTIGLGIAGSFTGGLVNFLLGMSGSLFNASGLIMSVVGGLIFSFAYSYYVEKKNVQ